MRIPIAMFVLGAGAVAASSAVADEHGCQPVDASIVTSFVACPADFQSPVGLCTQGTIDSGPLKGTTLFRVMTLVPGSADTMLYTGELRVTTKHGTVTLKDAGVLDAATGRYFEVQTVVGGTGQLEHATGLLTSQGFDIGTGFVGSLTGAICHGGKGHRDDDS